MKCKEEIRALLVILFPTGFLSECRGGLSVGKLIPFFPLKFSLLTNRPIGLYITLAVSRGGGGGKLQYHTPKVCIVFSILIGAFH